MNDMNRNSMMDTIMKASFAMYDTLLFLDTHPDCAPALEYYQEAKQVRDAAMCEYERKYGAITPYHIDDSDEWTWNDGVMPWEGGHCKCGTMKKD